MKDYKNCMKKITLRCKNSEEAKRLKYGILNTFAVRNGNLNIETERDEFGYSTIIEFDQERISQDELTGFWQGMNFELETRKQNNHPEHHLL